MLDDVVKAFSMFQLALAPEKVKFMAEKHFDVSEPPVLKLEGTPICKVEHVKILGSLIYAKRNEKGTFEHRFGAGCACYNKWRHILESKACIESRLMFFAKTVSWSLVWALQRTRPGGHNHSGMQSTQKFMVRKCLRYPGNPSLF